MLCVAMLGIVMLVIVMMLGIITFCDGTLSVVILNVVTQSIFC